MIMKSFQSKLKVCGLTKLNQIHELISINVDFLGFIFYEKSPRYVLNHLKPSDIAKINHQGKVGVFVNENLEKIVETTEQAELNFIQLHGNENENFISVLRKKLDPTIGIIKVIRIGMQAVTFPTNVMQNDIAYLLFDTDSKAFGGTGKQFDWHILNELDIPLPYFLSGGISKENIDNIKILNRKPFAVDINSKFEIEPGIKDMDKIKSLKIL